MNGTCMDMCPELERKQREIQRRLHSLEILQETKDSKRSKADRLATIKEYSRPAAGKADVLTSDLRPLHILLKTTKYMMTRILGRNDYPFVQLYDFVFDRLRSVRQDLVIQRACGPMCIEILEIAVRFHLHSGYRLCTEHVSRYDSKINDDHTQECLKRLLILYQDSELDGEDRLTNRLHREEMEALYLLFNLGSTEAHRHALSLPKKLRQLPSIHLALRIYSAHLQGNFVRVWRLASCEGDYLQSCALHRHLRQCRWQAFQLMKAAYSSKILRFPIGVLVKWLLFDKEEQAADFCGSCGLVVDGSTVQFLKAVNCTSQPPAVEYKCRKLVDCKLQATQVCNLLLGIQGDASSGGDIIGSTAKVNQDTDDSCGT